MRKDSSRPVFIIGGSRTGSTMLQTILSKSPEISLTDEIQFRSPWWLHRDLITDIRRQVGPLDADGAQERLIDLFYSGEPTGWFWSAAERLLDPDILKDELAQKPLTIQSIFHSILTAHARSRGKRRIGAKFPVHYSYAGQLLEWYPDCLLIHTTRNPKAVYASQAAKYLDPTQHVFSKMYMRFKQFVHINIQISYTAHMHKRLRNLPNYRLCRYEDLVLAPETEIRSLCDFLGIEFQAGMLKPHQFGSSFDSIGLKNQGIEKSSLERWRSSISPITAKLMDLTHRRAYRLLGYSAR
jgi:hypothetical protein